jgi:O-antigen/teichoic acid export membrane protein
MEEAVSKQNFSKIALKNSSYTLLSLFLLKFGGLIFTIIIARLLLPELFGIFALALSTVTIFLTFTNLGLDHTLARYISEAVGKKNNDRARTFFRYLFKIKYILVAVTIIVLVSLSKVLSYGFYDKPLLFYPLIFSCLFMAAESFKNFFASIFLATKNIKPIPFLESLHQITKISFSVLAVLVLSPEFKIAGLLVAFGLAGFIHLFFLILILFKQDKQIFFGKKIPIKTSDKKRISKFLRFMSIASISLVFFGSIDTIMLGKFVDAEFIAYYRVALSLVLTIASIFSMSSVLLPMFTQIHKKRFVRGFQKTFRYLMLIAIPATIGTVFIGRYLIFIIYGKEYLLAASSLYFLAILIITMPLTTLYNTIFESKEKTKILANSLIISLIINVILNLALIKYLLSFGQEYVIIGVGVATVISRLIYLVILSFNAKKTLKLTTKGIGLRSPIFATLIMALFLLVFNHFIDINIIYGAIEIILGAGIYFGVLILTKGATKEDWNVLMSLIKKKTQPKLSE